ncbi:MAG: hypothetical protein Q7S09_02085 [bacterium]|nr:hypothetical protein [bacterium]
MRPESLRDIDVLICLAETIPSAIWSMEFTGTHAWAYPIEDFHGARGPWKQFLKEVEGALRAGRRIFACCEGGHGRTGMFLASMIALLEKSSDPVAIVRERYCREAVETLPQMQTIFSLLEQEVPPHYRNELADRETSPLLRREMD